MSNRASTITDSTELRSVKTAQLRSPLSYTSNLTKSALLTDIEELPSGTRPSRSRSNAPISFYNSLSWMMGFKEKYSLVCMVVFGGALLGFCLARSMLLNPANIVAQTVPGEFFYFQHPMYKINYYIHIYFTLIGGIFVGLQFTPALRRRAVVLHRVNGYFCLFLLVPGNICGSIIAYRSFGGEINVQAAYYALGIMITFCGIIGLYNVKKETRQHRKWMMRLVVYFSVVITARLIMMAAREIISRMGNYHALWRCDEMMYLLSDNTLAQQRFPECFGVNPSQVYIPILASTHTDKLGLVSSVRVVQGMALWIATLIHVVGVEIYLNKTESMNYARYGYVLEARDFDGNGEQPWVYRQ